MSLVSVGAILADSARTDRQYACELSEIISSHKPLRSTLAPALQWASRIELDSHLAFRKLPPVRANFPRRSGDCPHELLSFFHEASPRLMETADSPLASRSNSSRSRVDTLSLWAVCRKSERARLPLHSRPTSRQKRRAHIRSHGFGELFSRIAQSLHPQDSGVTTEPLHV